MSTVGVAKFLGCEENLGQKSFRSRWALQIPLIGDGTDLCALVSENSLNWTSVRFTVKRT